MAVLSLASFLDQLRILNYDFYLSDNTVHTQSRSGQSFVASQGPRLWKGTITCAPWSIDGSRRLEALADQIQIPGNYFQFCPLKAETPINYSSGFNMNGVATNGDQAAGYSLKLKGLPVGFEISAGDYLSFTVNGIDRLHRVGADITVPSTGNVTVTLSNALPHGDLPSADLFVRFINPRMTAMFIPGTFTSGNIGRHLNSGFSFSFIQATRV